MLSSTVSSSFFFHYVDKRLDHGMYHGVDDHFLEHPCAREQKRDNDPEQGQLFFLGQGSVSFIGAAIRVRDNLYIDFFESLVYYRVFGSGGFSRLLKLNLT